MKNTITYLSALILLAYCSTTASSCQGYLELKSSGNLATPETLGDVELLLKDYLTQNSGAPNGSEVASDNFYVSLQNLNSVAQRERSAYRWEADDMNQLVYWSNPYKAIFAANVIMETLDGLEATPELRETMATYRSMAVFWRAFHHYTLTQLFCRAYGAPGAQDGLGLPLKVTADIDDVPKRSSLRDTYTFILDELQSSLEALPPKVDRAYQPSKPAAYAMLSRVYLSMGRYEEAGAYADSCLLLYDVLLDYNEVAVNQNVPFQRMNDEVILDVQATASALLNRSRGRVDSNLVGSYDANDLRGTAFFVHNADGSKSFKGHYSGSSGGVQFVGLATDEVLLTRAECYARAGHVGPALRDLNRLMQHRWRSGTFVEIEEQNPEELLRLILSERRKELLFRCLRWTDIRRLNVDPRFRQVLYRVLPDEVLVLQPDDDRYVFKIPLESIEFSGIEQNP